MFNTWICNRNQQGIFFPVFLHYQQRDVEASSALSRLSEKIYSLMDLVAFPPT